MLSRICFYLAPLGPEDSSIEKSYFATNDFSATLDSSSVKIGGTQWRLPSARLRTRARLAGCMKERGIAAIGRYYTKNRSNTNILTADEAHHLSQAGIKI
jgi:hypothetical protein